jgi:SM-20-related protein
VAHASWLPDGDAEAACAAIAAALARDGISVRDGFLGGAGVAALAACAQARYARDEFAPARIGSARARRRCERIRGDAICWLAEPLFDAESRLLAALEALRLSLNREATLGLFDLELHYARYPPGAHYARHVDQPLAETARQVSLILYLNEDWQPADGGALRLFDRRGGYRDVAPLGGRLVSFLTDGCEHAVLPASHARWSLSGWFRRRAA